MSKNSNANMALADLEGTVKDNFNKLNRLFGDGAFNFQVGKLTTSVTNIASTPQVMVVYYQRCGHLITLQFDRTIVAAAKINASNPALAAPLPTFLRPFADVYNPCIVQNNGGTAEANNLFVTAAGVVSWTLLAAAWGVGAISIYPTPITYLGN